MARSKKTRVFVSYSRHDEALVRPLAGLLGVARDAVFLDVSSLQPGDPWDEKILGAIKEASVFVLCWCCACEGSSFVAKEIGAVARLEALAGFILGLRSWFATIRTQNERRQAEEIAAKATSYFEGLGGREAGGHADP